MPLDMEALVKSTSQRKDGQQLNCYTAPPFTRNVLVFKQASGMSSEGF